jgi:hypothetical protein
LNIKQLLVQIYTVVPAAQEQYRLIIALLKLLKRWYKYEWRSSENYEYLQAKA